jgi:hypothetical protein
MDASHGCTGPDAGSSIKPSLGAARRSSRSKGPEKASDSGADTTPQPKISSKTRSTKVIKKPKVRISTKPKSSEGGTKIPKRDSSARKQDLKITLEKAKTAESTRLAAETASTPGNESSTSLSASTIKPDNGLSVPNLPSDQTAPLNRAPPFSNQPDTLRGPHMPYTYSSPYGHAQLGEYHSATHRHPIYPGVPMGELTSSQRLSLPPVQNQPPNILASYTCGTTKFPPARGRTPSVAEYVAAKRLAPAITHEGNRMMTSPHKFVSLSNVQLTRDLLPPYPPLPPASHILPSQLPEQSRSTATPGVSVPLASGICGDVSGATRKAETPGTTTNTGRNFHNQRPFDHDNPAGRPDSASKNSSISLIRLSGGDNREQTFQPSVVRTAVIPGRDLQIQNGLPLDNLASHSAPTDSGVGLTSASGDPAVLSSCA